MRIIQSNLLTELQTLILDNFHNVIEAEPPITSRLQVAWDLLLQAKNNLALVLVSSDVAGMLRIRFYSQPLYGRFSHPWKYSPLPFASLQAWFPDYTPLECLKLYGVLAVGAAGVREFAERIRLAEPTYGRPCHLWCVLFCLAGFTEAAQAEARSSDICLVDQEQLLQEMELFWNGQRHWKQDEENEKHLPLDLL